MKKLLSIFSLSLLLLIASCRDESYGPTTYEFATIDTSDIPESVTEDSDETVTIPVLYGGTLSNATAFTVNYKIEGGTYGADYVVVGGSAATGSVSIPAGTTGDKAIGLIEIVPVADLKKEPNVELTITLVDASNGLSLGFPGAKSYTFTVEDDDCDYVEANFIGTAAGREFYDDGSTYPTDPDAPGYDVGFTSTGTNAFEMDNFWGSSYHVAFTIDPTTFVVTVPGQDIEDGFHVDGTGTVSTCGKTITITMNMDGPGYTGTFKNVYTFPE